MPAKRRRIYLHDPAPLKCPDCLEPTVVDVASLLGTLNTSVACIGSEALRHMLTDAKQRWSASLFKDTTRHSVGCASCDGRTSKVHWVVLGVDHIAGPWCIRCLRSLVGTEIEGEIGLKQDLYVLAITASTQTYRRVKNVEAGNPQPSPDTDVVF